MILLGDHPLNLREVEQILLGEKVELSPGALKVVEESYFFLRVFSKDKIIYGINTGFGPMAQYRVPDNERVALQLNLIRSHCSGSGNPISAKFSKAIMLSRLNTLLQGKSGVHPDLVNLLTALINADAVPVIYEHGGVGASGDLVQLAHLALALIGEGEFWYQGEIKPASEVLQTLRLKPLQIDIREGLALMNGTSGMTGIAAINLIQAQRLIDINIRYASILYELLSTYDDHFSIALNEAKLHQGQRYVAAQIQANCKGSSLIKHRHLELYNKKIEKEIFEDKIQEYYSIRCVPQIVGPIYDTIQYAKTVIENELNSTHDNPIIDAATQNVYHGGNFHGDYVALEMDKVKLAITKLSILMERQLNYLLNFNLNGMFPPFLNAGIKGFNFGVQGIQFTATSTVSENQSIASSNYIHNIPNNNDNQDVVSMGFNAAVYCHKIVENTFEVSAILAMAVAYAVKIKGIESQMLTPNQSFINEIVSITGFSKEDEPSFVKLRTLKQFLKGGSAL